MWLAVEMSVCVLERCANSSELRQLKDGQRGGPITLKLLINMKVHDPCIIDRVPHILFMHCASDKAQPSITG